jgi:hypothetical protein
VVPKDTYAWCYVQYPVTSVATPLSNLTLKHLSHSLQHDVDHEILHVPPLGHEAFLGKFGMLDMNGL